ncbi:hypothetical protein SODALDRAFT_378442 [Sodiomyces alkalinus F11]|uniref:Sorting nexin-4 n=1 Tax=Sodiomyces alkalinus (strain CBS 110278 / VKM F-3762 / F11) TaxID=1314773 RepID=A0A3N2PXT0_SODAK|nr:hypothetical protein SODALDRAFT_378442 [Sodiomyces alkalinus F11]ROT39343.1 hypothetical protein SODALDRAFT_378442 [Sodiomyces alkalinus F11]
MARIEQDDFSNVSWHSERPSEGSSAISEPSHAHSDVDASDSNGHSGPDPSGLGPSAGLGGEVLECTVSSPLKENEGSKDVFVSYLITTYTTFPDFQKPTSTVRRRFTDFVFLYKALYRDFPTAAVPPLPDKQRMEYVRGDRFGPDFTHRRAHSLQRFLTRLSLHPVLRRADILHIFLESPDWNATMRTRSVRLSQSSDSGGVLDNLTESFMTAFSKVHKPDRRFIEVRERSDKLDDGLASTEKVVARVARREHDIVTDQKDLAEQFQKLIVLEPGVETAVHHFAASMEDSAQALQQLREITEQDYLGSLRDMQAYSQALKSLLKAREQKQVDYEQLIEYLNKATAERDSAQSGYGQSGLSGASGFLTRKLEDVRGVDHEQARRERRVKLERRIDELTTAIEQAKRASEGFDNEVVKEVNDFERIKRAEFRTQLGGLADAHLDYYNKVIDVWEGYVREMEKEGTSVPTDLPEPPGRQLV